MSSTLPNAALIFGPPGSGKGTVGSKLAACTNLYHLSTGDIFRGLPADSDNGRLFYQYSNQGKLVPDEVSVQIFSRYLKGLIDTNCFDPSKQILLLDGMPRTPAQAGLIQGIVNVRQLIVLEIKEDQEIINRILGRAAIEGRKDDGDEEIIRNRISEYNSKTAAVLGEYDLDLQSHINGQQSPIEVFSDVVKSWVDFLKKTPDLS